ncbi:MAG: ATP-binding cassette domain-containing protein [Treponema sp.]|nr:ATP-binding cassette domain-containing protein [Treponema sp.]
MTISIRDLSFGYTAALLFNRFSAELDGGEGGRPLVILGHSGCGKTTLLKLLGGLLKPQSGQVDFSGGGAVEPANSHGLPAKTSFMFQESRLLPWLTVEQNIALPLEKEFGKKAACERARHFLSLVFLDEKAAAYPQQLSGGQAQRVSMARAFAWRSAALFMDEPFQSLDIPLRINLMDMCLSLNERENRSKNRLLVAVTHDPREAIYMGGRIIILGAPGHGIIFDRTIDLSAEERAFGSPTAAALEREMLTHLSA